MIEQDCTLLINRIYNWLDSQNTISLSVRKSINNYTFERTVNGKVKNNYLQLAVQIPCSIQDNIQIRLTMKSQSQLGKLIINVKEASLQYKKYYLLQPKQQHLIQIQFKTTCSTRQQSQQQTYQSILNELNKSNRKKEDEKYNISLQKKYRIKQKSLIRSVSQSRQNFNRMSTLTKQLIAIHKQLRSKSKSRSKLLQLKQCISQQKLKFNEIVYPYIEQRTPRRAQYYKTYSSKGSTKSTFTPHNEYGFDSIKNDKRNKFQTIQ